MREEQKDGELDVQPCQQVGPSEDDISASSDTTCPYPSGFGPCRNGTHVHNVVNSNQEHVEGILEIQHYSTETSNPNLTKVSVEKEIDTSFVPESIAEQIEASETRRLCEEGGFYLQESSDDVLLRDWLGYKKKGKGVKKGKPKNTKGGGRGRGRRRVVLASSKRSLQSGMKLNSK
ncbi:hypothetical protein PIB30_031197 [Stylosanthes scabra]|uniref:Uncharacterized protein n=1 Tax=Stylosanthes scabra TaxID=79078 RepID=A0ABU6RC12_9FABA|nr:hypothetical protein [Stylosanthes scabra]